MDDETPTNGSEDLQGGSGTTTGEEGGAPPEGEVTPPAEPVSFSHPSLAGKSPAEIESYVSLLEGANREMQTAPRETQPPAEPERPQPKTDFFSDPDRRFAEERDALVSEMDRMIAPFRADMAETRAHSVHTRMAELYGDEWTKLKPSVDVLVQQAKGDPSNFDQVHLFFMTARGMSMGQGQPHTPPTSTRGTGSAPPAGMPPQHRPSGAPLPREGGAPPKREFTEQERRIMKEQGMSEEQYSEWDGLDIGDIANSKIGMTS